MHSDRKEWNEELVRQIFYPFDADEICKIRIPSSDVEDRIAWYYEKSGEFSVRSAYKLAAASLPQLAQNPSSSSSDPNDRSIWDLIWKAKVSGKVRIFGWRVATSTLATKENKWKRTLELDATCNICGNGTETEHHAVVMCTKSRALREAMRKVWNLPNENRFWYTGENWLRTVLHTENEEMHAKILLLFWRCWHMREDCIRNNGRESICGSVQFLKQYEEELKNAEMKDVWSGGKDATSVHGTSAWVDALPGSAAAGADGKWIPPIRGVVKVNTDAAFRSDIGESATGAVGRDYRGSVLMSICKRLPQCHTAEEAEARAILVGLQAISGLFNGQVILETDNQ